jgi:uncharacterized membrane protein YqjE
MAYEERSTPNASGDGVAATVAEISQRTSVLIREEIELAKAEVTEKVTKLVKGAVVAIAAGIFAVFGLVYLLHGFAWLIDQLFFDTAFWGFFIVAAFLFLAGGLAGYVAARWLRSGAPPTPDMAIDEAQRIRATFSGEHGGPLETVVARHDAAAPAEQVKQPAGGDS